MHGQRRDKYKARLKDEKIANALQVKATQWFQLTKVLVHKRHNDDDNDNNNDTMNLIEKLLLVNPDPIHLWNHRRDLLLLGESNNNNNFSIEKELVLTRQALERNPKAYGPWFHRKWSIGYFLKQQQHDDADSLLQKEVALTEQFLMLDERNFHCWNYRRFLIGCQMEILLLLLKENEEGKTLSTTGIFDGHWPELKDVMTTTTAAKSYQMGPQVGVTTSHDDDDNDDDKNTPQQQTTIDSSNNESSLQLFHELLKKEWDFTTTKMTQNFSNGSALHYRLQLLLLLLNSTSSKKEDENVVEKELELCHDAIFTEPDDQTTWWYYKELIKFDIMNKNQELIQSEIDLLHELLDSEEQNCKWAWIGLNCLLEQKQQQQMMSGKEKDNDNDGESTTTTTIATIKEQRKNVYENLIRLDPDRQNRYRYLMKKLE